MADSVSILCLNDDCLTEIANHITDYKSFYGFALTCKRFYQALQSTDGSSHHCLPMVNRKLKFCLTKCVVEDWVIEGKVNQDYQYPTVETLMKMYKSYQVMNPFYDLLVKVWESQGPSVSALLMYIQDVIYKCGYTGPRNDISTKEKQMILKLPKSRKTLKLLTLHNGKSLYLRVFFEGYFNTMKSIAPKCLNVEESELEHLSECDIKKIVDPFRSVINILQKEVGKRLSPITDRSFLWLMFFPDSLEFSTLTKRSESSQHLKSSSRNEQLDTGTKPTPKDAERTVESMKTNNALLVRLGQSVHLQRVAGILSNDLPKYKLEVLNAFVLGSAKRIIHYQTNNLFGIPKTLSLKLIMRIKPFPSSYCGWEQRKELYFHGANDKVLEVAAGFETGQNPSHIPSYITFNVDTPEKAKVIFSQEEIKLILGLRLNSEMADKAEILLMVEKLAPFTEFVKECFGEEDLGRDEINDIFVAVFFLDHLLL